MVARRPYTAAILLLALALALPAAAEVGVSLDRNPVQVNESFQLVFSLDEMPDRDPDFAPLAERFDILGNNRSNSISIINGEYRRSVKWTLQLMAREAGEFTIPPIRFGRERSAPVALKVLPSDLAAAPQDELVLELKSQPDEVFVQQQAIVTLRLLSAGNLSAYQFGDIEIAGVDAVIEPLGDVRQYTTRVGGQSYLVLEKQVALFPQQGGRLEIGPVMAEVRLPSRSSLDPFRRGGEIRRLRSDVIALEVTPIPPAWDAAVWLPASRVTLRERWQGDVDRLAPGEPITRTVSLLADGLTAAQLPEIPLPAVDGIKQYPDQPALDNERAGDGLRGRRVQKVALIPSAAGRYTLPAVSLPWWNIESGALEIATLPARELVVGSPATGAAPDSPPIAEPAPIAGPAPAAAAPPAPGPVNRLWPVLSLLLACGWGASSFYWWWSQRRRYRQELPGAARETESLGRARRFLRQTCAQNNAAAARRALLAWGRALLAPRRVDNLGQLERQLGDELGAEIERINQALYAPGQAAWQGDSLWRLCRQIEAAMRRDSARAPRQLEPLNPPA